MSTQLDRPRTDAGNGPATMAGGGPPTTKVVESVSSGRLIALLLAVVGLSILTTMFINNRDSVVAAGDQEVAAGDVAPGDAAAGDQVGAAAVSDASMSLDAGADVTATIVPRAELLAVSPEEVNVATAPAMPPPSGRTEPAVVDVAFEVVENVSTIDPNTGAQFETWGYRVVDGDDGLVVGTPGPVIRARVGDVLRFTITNPAGNAHPHNVDFHAVTGQGGGAADTTVEPGETATIEARMLYPGFFMYHCAYGDVPSHISHGMYGGILVDPETPLPEVAHEWYVVQSEYYLGAAGPDGVSQEDRVAISNEVPTQVVFNGSVGAIAGDNALQMQVGERARLYFVNAGLNLISSFHPIGSHWDAVYREAALLNAPLRGSQTTLVPAGGATVVDLVGQVPQTVVLVDHALSRAFDKGAIGQIVISGEENPEIFDAAPGDAPSETADAVATGPTTAATEPAAATPAASAAAATATGASVTIPRGAGTFREVADGDFSDAALGGYDAPILEVAVGDTVTWTNDDVMVHTVTAQDGSFDSDIFGPGETWSYTFTEAGEFNYACTPHPWMRGRIVVS